MKEFSALKVDFAGGKGGRGKGGLDSLSQKPIFQTHFIYFTFNNLHVYIIFISI